MRNFQLILAFYWLLPLSHASGRAGATQTLPDEPSAVPAVIPEHDTSDVPPKKAGAKRRQLVGGVPLATVLVLHTDVALTGTTPSCPSLPELGPGKALFKGRYGLYCSHALPAKAAQFEFASANALGTYVKSAVAAVDLPIVVPQQVSRWRVDTQTETTGVADLSPPPSEKSIPAQFRTVPESAEEPAPVVSTTNLTDDTLRQYGWQPDLPAATFPVRVTVIDTAPGQSRAAHDRNEHGRLAGLLIRDLACGGPQSRLTSCPVNVTHELATPRYLSDSQTLIDRERGGDFGTFADLAGAIQRATDAWDSDTDGPLILNLGVGWQRDEITEHADFKSVPAELGSDSPQQSSVSLQNLPDNVVSLPELAVYEALGKAYCKGALIVTAAGNRHDDSEEAAYPGAWSQDPAPNCSAYGLAPRALSSTGEPWLLRASAIDSLGQPLSSTPLHGLAELNAYGLQVSAEDGVATSTDQNSGALRNNVIGPMSGSSLAAAGISGVVGALYAHSQDLQDMDIQDWLLQHSTPIRDGGVVSVSSLLREVQAAQETTTPQTLQLPKPKRARVSLCHSLSAAGLFTGACDSSDGLGSAQTKKPMSPSNVSSGDACVTGDGFPGCGVCNPPWLPDPSPKWPIRWR